MCCYSPIGGVHRAAANDSDIKTRAARGYGGTICSALSLQYTYRFHLPTGAPVKAPYASGGTLTFTADAPLAGKYTIQAQSPGKTTQTKPADISGGNATASFSFAP